MINDGKCKYCGAPGYANRQEYCASKPKQSVSEQMQGELEPLPGVKKWDDMGSMDVLKHGRE